MPLALVVVDIRWATAHPIAQWPVRWSARSGGSESVASMLWWLSDCWLRSLTTRGSHA